MFLHDYILVCEISTVSTLALTCIPKLMHRVLRRQIDAVVSSLNRPLIVNLCTLPGVITAMCFTLVINQSTQTHEWHNIIFQTFRHSINAWRNQIRVRYMWRIDKILCKTDLSPFRKLTYDRDFFKDVYVVAVLRPPMYLFGICNFVINARFERG